MKLQDIILGHIYTDRITGITGYACAFIETMSGNTQVEIRPLATAESARKARLLDGIITDPHSLDVAVLCAANPIACTEPQVMVDVRLGDRVKDIATGITGIATVRVTSLNGCIGYQIPVQNRQTGMFELIYIDQCHIEIIQSKMADVRCTEVVAGNNPGGPKTKVLSYKFGLV